MNIVEIRLKVYLLKEIRVKEGLECISKLIDTCLVNSGDTLFHEKNQMKLYSFSGLYPLAVQGKYQAGGIYSIMIRTLDERVAEVLERNLDRQSTAYMKALTLEKRIIKQKHLDEIFTLTPVIVKFQGKKEGYWRSHHTIEEFEEHLRVRLIKKYNAIYGTKVDEDFEWMNYIRIINQKPIVTAYKNIGLLGDKVSIKVAENPLAQELAWISVGSGLGEMTTRGMGFTNYRYL